MNQRLVLLVDALCKQALEKDGEGWVVTPEFVLALSGTVGKLCTDLFAEDLIAFSQHAKRKTVAIEDVLLLVRRSPDLVRRVEAVMNEEKPRKRQR
ncbi:hypothetical protein BASA81_012356 [Batrachochytrium salamandrivorans]|nr:hypothetical protein BASA81_012356 [Batrachochytrium salamandrivorans]